MFYFTPICVCFTPGVTILKKHGFLQITQKASIPQIREAHVCQAKQHEKQGVVQRWRKPGVKTQVYYLTPMMEAAGAQCQETASH